MTPKSWSMDRLESLASCSGRCSAHANYQCAVMTRHYKCKGFKPLQAARRQRQLSSEAVPDASLHFQTSKKAVTSSNPNARMFSGSTLHHHIEDKLETRCQASGPLRVAAPEQEEVRSSTASTEAALTSSIL